VRILRPGFDPEAFFASVASAPARALLLDYDGTLAPFQRQRDRAFPYPGVRERLTGLLEEGSTRLSIVSGRPLADLSPLLSLPRAPDLWGSHGLERRTASGASDGAAAAPQIASLVERAAEWSTRRGWGEGFERKPYGFAIHGRGVPAERLAAVRVATLERWGEAASAAGLELLDFDGGFEFRPSGSHKGDVVRAILAEAPRGAAVAYLGDDRTDEDAFEVLSGLGAGVLVRPELRSTAADLWIRPPEELLDFLDRWRQAARPAVAPPVEGGTGN
jgi:trehalose 6-phosphate phosphatase